MQANSFNLINTVRVLKNKWKQLLLFVFIAMTLASITLLLVPKYYRSSAILLPANPALADKAHLFNNNIKELYSNFGSGDDLERLLGIAAMDTVNKQLVDEFNLVDYYQLKNDAPSVLRRKALIALKENLNLQRTELDQIKISIWTKDKTLSAKIVNRLVEIIKTKEEAIWKSGYENELQKINASIARFEREYGSINENGLNILALSKKQNLLEQMNLYQKTANDLKLAIENNQPALYVLETAVPAAKSERPNVPDTLIATFLISLVFGSIVLLVYNREPTL
ncbi:MAG: hypothetical protein K2Q21_12920 [Chitinophagaceae bacterium]|nr:hypothetical protein [Chitinophagaceae bacterium]